MQAQFYVDPLQATPTPVDAEFFRV